MQKLFKECLQNRNSGTLKDIKWYIIIPVKDAINGKEISMYINGG